MTERIASQGDYVLLLGELAAMAASHLEAGHRARSGDDRGERPAQRTASLLEEAAPILSRVAVSFGLSPFERAILLAAAGIEVDKPFTVPSGLSANRRAVGGRAGRAATSGGSV